MLDTLKILVILHSLHSDYVRDIREQGIDLQKHEIEFRFEAMDQAEGRCDINGDIWVISIDPQYPEACLKMLIYHELTHAYFRLEDTTELKIMDYRRIMMRFRRKDWNELISKLKNSKNS